MSRDRPLSVAYWYPEPYWADADAGIIKSLLPFFDEVAILLPGYMHGRHRDENPWLVSPLEDQGLLRVLEPGEFIDEEMAVGLHAILSGLLAAGAFDHLDIPNQRYGYHELSGTRLGWNADVKLSTEIIDELVSRRLALPSEDGLSIPLHPTVRTTVLVLLSQLAPARARAQGIDLLPVTPDRARVRDLVRILKLPVISTAGEVVALDTEAVGADLTDAPLDAVLEFRDLHGEEFRNYMRNVRKFVRDLSTLGSDERESVLVDRQEELSDLAASLRRTTRTYWHQPMARIAVGGAGAILSLATGSALPGALGAVAALLEWEPPQDAAGPFSYLFEVEQSLGI